MLPSYPNDTLSSWPFTYKKLSCNSSATLCNPNTSQGRHIPQVKVAFGSVWTHVWPFYHATFHAIVMNQRGWSQHDCLQTWCADSGRWPRKQTCLGVLLLTSLSEKTPRVLFAIDWIQCHTSCYLCCWSWKKNNDIKRHTQAECMYNVQ